MSKQEIPEEVFLGRPKLYIETSVFGFYYDERKANQSKREATRTLFEQIKIGLFEAYVSATTVSEINRVEDTQRRSRLLDLPEEFSIDRLTLNREEIEKIEFLARAYVEGGAVPSEKVDDAIHIATMVVRPDLSILVTWNHKHIANINVERKAKAITLQNEYEFNFRIATPEEVIVYEQT